MNLITGANGFIGGRLARALHGDGLPVRCAGGPNAEGGLALDLVDVEALRDACQDVTTVYHCAGFAHALAAESDEVARRHWQVNGDGTRNLVMAAGAAGVRRFVFLSTVKAMGEPGAVMVDEDFAAPPESDYGQSKLAGERAVLEAGQRFGMHVVNLRLCMVYGAGGRGNLERMARWVRKGLFPPLPETGNHRSLVHVADVVAAARRVAADDRAGGRTYIVAGPEAPSGRVLFDTIRQVCGLPPVSWSIPAGVLGLAARTGDLAKVFIRRRLPFDSEICDRLLGSGWYSGARIAAETGWRPDIGLRDGLTEMLRNETSV